MAQTVICDGPDDNPAVFIVSNLEAAEAVAMCMGCMLDFAYGLLGQLSPQLLAPPPDKAPKRRRPAARSSAPQDGKGGSSDASSEPQTAGTAAGIGEH